MRRGARRGLTLVELLVGTGIGMFVFYGVLTFTNTATLAWTRTTTLSAQKSALGQATIRVVPYLRNALRVDAAHSGPDHITVVMPATDVSGMVQAPLTDGASVSFYLSDSSGIYGNQGSILWMSANGVPQQDFASGAGGNGVTLATAGLLFTYSPVSAPNTVTVSFTSIGNSIVPQSHETSQVFLRNQGIEGN